MANATPRPDKVPSVLRDICGSMHGYRAHSKNNELYCPPCKDSNNERFRKWYEGAAEAERLRWRKNMEDPDQWLKHEVNKRVHGRKRRAALKDVYSEPYTDQDVIDKWGSDCHWCGGPIDLSLSRKIGDPGWSLSLHLDHVMPISKGGDDTLANVKPTHAICNMSKHTKES